VGDTGKRTRVLWAKDQYFLEKEYGISVSVPKIYEILAEKYVIKSKWKKNQTEDMNLKIRSN